MQLRPKQQRVVHGKHENSGHREDDIIFASSWEQMRSAYRHSHEHEDRDEKTNRHERNGREIAQSDFDGKPGGAPNNAKGHPGDWHTPPNFRSPPFSQQYA